MDNMIAYCGLDCEECNAYRATVNDDAALREKTAKLWSELNHVPIPPEQIRCEGCRRDGLKTPYCESLCPIRQCARKKERKTCGDCPDMEACGKVGEILANAPFSRENLRRSSREKGRLG